MMGRILAKIALALMIAMGSVHAEEKGAPSRPTEPAPEDLEIIAIMEVLELMDLADEMEMIEKMEYLVEEKQNESTTD